MYQGENLSGLDLKNTKLKRYILYCIPGIIAISAIIDFTLTVIFSNGKEDIIEHESNPILVFAFQHNIAIPVVILFSLLVFILTYFALKFLKNNNLLFFSATILIIFLASMRIIIGFSWYYRSSDFSYIMQICTFSVLIPVFGIFVYSIEENGVKNCNHCGREMEYILKYNEHYCWNCDTYYNEKFENNQFETCPRCYNDLEYISEYNDYYCWNCDIYPREEFDY